MIQTSTKIQSEADPRLGRNKIDYNYKFFTTSTTKLVIMSIFTFGIYELYWFYKNWVLIKNAGKKCSPFWRALFSPIFAYSCFSHIRESMNSHKISASFPAGILAITYIILNASCRLPDPFWLISIFSFLPVIAANNVALSVNKSQSPDFVNNKSFSKWNFLTIALGGTMLIISIVGIFLPAA